MAEGNPVPMNRKCWKTQVSMGSRQPPSSEEGLCIEMSGLGDACGSQELHPSSDEAIIHCRLIGDCDISYKLSHGHQLEAAPSLLA